MEQMRAQCRMLVCNALFSFGCLCGALTLFRLSPEAVSRIYRSGYAFILSKPLLLLPMTAVLGMLLMLAAGPSIFCILIISILFVVYGFLGGASAFCVMRFSGHPVMVTAFLLLCSFCLVQIGASVLRRAFMMRRQNALSGLTRPDRLFDAPRIVCAFIVLLLAASAFTIFILNY
jgi:hypothetical protein